MPDSRAVGCPPSSRAAARVTRRTLLGYLGAAASLSASVPAVDAAPPISFGLTPVFLDSDIQLLADLQSYLEHRLERSVTLVKRRTYQEITALLLSGQLDAAWICGFPFAQYHDQLALMAVPLYRNQPLYQSYLIVNEDSSADSLGQLYGTIHAFSDPDSNSGFLVTRHLLAMKETTPAAFFRSSFFTYGHRNVIRAVASGLAEGGSVDGYVWDVMSAREPALVHRTRVIRKSELLGFPPVAGLKTARGSPQFQAIAAALIDMAHDPRGEPILRTLQLDGFTAGSPDLFDSIAQKWRVVREQSS